MVANRIPGPLMGLDSCIIDDGTLCRALSPSPGPVCRVEPRQWHAWSAPQGFAPASLRLSPDGVSLLQSIEKLALIPYDDQSGKDITSWVSGATIGYGHLIAKADWSLYQKGLTLAAAESLFLADLAPFETVVGQHITRRLQQYQFDALVILAFNIGPGHFQSSSVAKLVNDPQAVTAYANLEAAWMAWNKSQGKVMEGLDNRRRCEWLIYTTARYVAW
jgi:lysozyme